MKAGTATKLVLNMISTAVMVRLGFVYGNLMVNVQPRNSKLRDRATRIVARSAAISYERAGELLVDAGDRVAVAIVMARLSVDRESAEARLAAAGGRISEALKT
jgi:N-acetylmuramic acid 6-phosphate etherase